MPYRSVDEHEVINGLFSSTDANATHLTAGAGDAGVFVRITVGDLNEDPLVYVDGAGRSDLIGKVDYPDVGRNWIPVVTNKFDTATRAEKCIGVTLAQTALADENGVTFYNDPRKAEANGIVPSGGAVPIMARGLVTLCETAFENGDVLIGSVGQNLIVSATAGKVTGVAYTSTGHVHQVVGTVLATGSRTAGSTQDRFAGAAGTVGKYALCYIDCIGY
tara:strand:+ start:178 stop:834 length:657 start_codon:yes stop_codon:yes gene_type:complete